ncbi:MAG TPA: RIP metalloprotease RseP [Opitutaceae bacterium]|nr:RIP metalloprotease RseP [Opitutaceae bacterium]
MDLLHSLLSNLWSLFLVVFFFGSSIFVHELGHFLVARRRGVMVERFSIGMGPPIFRWKGKDGVEYWLSWFPLGGYVKLPQLADLRGVEGETKLDLSKLPSPTYATKILVFVAGAVFNVIFAFILATILWAAGMPDSEMNGDTRIGYVIPTLQVDGKKLPSPAAKADVRAGDVILEIDGARVSDWSDVRSDLALGSGRTQNGERLVVLKVRRGEQILDLAITPVLAGDERMRQIGVIHAGDVVFGTVPANTYAAQLGFKDGDRIIKMDTDTVYSLWQLSDYIESHSAAPVKFTVQRGKETVTIEMPPQKDASVLFKDVGPDTHVELVHQNPVTLIRKMVENSFQSLSSLINPRSDVGVANMTGPLGIAKSFWDAANSDYPVRVAAWLAVLINISLAVFNLLPIPVLDGGQIVFATIAKIRGRALPIDFVNATQSIFVVLLFSLMVYVSYHDISRQIKQRRARAEAEQTVPAKP